MLASDIVFEQWSEDRSRHTVERRCTLDIDAPYILKKVVELLQLCMRNVIITLLIQGSVVCLWTEGVNI